MNLPSNIPKDVRKIVADLSKRREFFDIIGNGGGMMEFEGRKFIIKPAFGGYSRRLKDAFGMPKAPSVG